MKFCAVFFIQEAAPLDEPKCLVASTAFTFPLPDSSGLVYVLFVLRESKGTFMPIKGV